MSSGVKLGLFISIFVVLAIGISVYIAILISTRRKQWNVSHSEKESHFNSVNNNQNLGELLWEIKEKTKNPLSDESLVYAISTLFRNKYKTSKVIGFNDDYEKKSLESLGKQKIVKDQNADFVLMNLTSDVVKLFEKEYDILNSKQMIFIVNANKKEYETKDLIYYLKQKSVLYDYEKVDRGIIIATK